MERLENSILSKMILAMQTMKELCGEFDSVMEEMQLEFLKELKQYRDTGLTPAEIMDGKLLTGWVPVEEQLPKLDEDGYAHVMVSMDDGFVTVTNYTRDDGFALWEESGDVIAWMPLPEPEKPERDRV